jgi:FkbM family methyltransferase
LRIIKRNFPWTTCGIWRWPVDDRKLLQVIDDVADVDRIMTHLDDLDPDAVCIQAGGACGVWPARLALEFGQVLTFEPLASNLDCLRTNTADLANVTVFPGALGNPPPGELRFVTMEQHQNEKHNAGSHQVAAVAELDPEARVPEDITYLFGIDKHVLPDLSGPLAAIMLDVEGFEIPALQGAERAIDMYSPLIVVEDKGLSTRYGHRKGDVEHWLRERGYEVVDRIKRDVVLKRPSRGPA